MGNAISATTPIAGKAGNLDAADAGTCVCIRIFTCMDHYPAISTLLTETSYFYRHKTNGYG